MKARLFSARTLAVAALAASALVAVPLQAQDNADASKETNNSSRVWGFSSPAGSYNVRIDHISSVSSTEYLIEGNIMVYEVTIDTVGQTTARFYYGEPWVPKTNVGAVENVTNRAREIAENTNQRAGQISGQVDRLVIKNYGIPNTTHAKTIEFKVANKQELGQIYKSVKEAWLKGRGRNLRVKDN